MALEKSKVEALLSKNVVWGPGVHLVNTVLYFSCQAKFKLQESRKKQKKRSEI